MRDIVMAIIENIVSDNIHFLTYTNNTIFGRKFWIHIGSNSFVTLNRTYNLLRKIEAQSTLGVSYLHENHIF